MTQRTKRVRSAKVFTQDQAANLSLVPSPGELSASKSSTGPRLLRMPSSVNEHRRYGSAYLAGRLH